MRHEIELQVRVQQPNDSDPQWYQLDIGNGNTLTLDYVSNLLSDVSKISSSRSFTVKLPRTRRNDTVLDLAVVPQHQSERPYRYLPCRVYVDGIDVAGEAFMYLVSAEASTYNAVIVFGLMREYKAWVDAGNGLKDLQDSGERIQWDWQAAYTDGQHPGQPEPNAPIWYGNDAASYVAQNGLNKAMYFGIYNPGFALTWPEVLWANVHPFVTVRELWERIVAENSLDFTLPNWVKLDMENLAIVLTKKSGNIPVGTPTSHTTQVADPLLKWSVFSAKFWFSLTDAGYFDTASQYDKIFSKGLKPVGLNINIVLDDAEDLIEMVGGDMTRLKLRVREISPNVPQVVTTGFAITPTQTTNSQIVYNGRVQLEGSEVEGDFIGYFFVDVDMTNEEWGTFRMDYIEDIQVSGAVQYQTYENTVDYPNDFLMIPNLPDIKQIDFVKMVCHLYGLFPCQRGGTVYFIPIDELEDNKTKAYDWSRYLLEDDPDAPHHTDWHMTDLARRNRASYKEDDKDPVVDEAFLDIDDDTLDPMKDFFTIPLAASDGDLIDQYDLTPEYDDTTEPPTFTGYKVDFTECEHRLMRVVQWKVKNETNIVLSFQNLSTAQILAERYSSYQAYVNQPRIITERLRVPLADLRTLDYSRPVFLDKYGRHFAIIDIKWTVTQDTCEAKLLML